MTENNELNCLGDPLHFSHPIRWAPPWSEELVAEPVVTARGWRSHHFDIWTSHVHARAPVAQQGWKIHVSTTPADAKSVLHVVAAACKERRVPFKHVRSTALVVAVNARSTHRSTSGKAIAIYPSDDATFLELVDHLATSLQGKHGPYVLTDRRWDEGAPVYFRYGAFLPMVTYTDDGRRVAARARGEALIEDDRRVPFRAPHDIHPPQPVAQHGGRPD